MSDPTAIQEINNFRNIKPTQSELLSDDVNSGIYCNFKGEYFVIEDIKDEMLFQDIVKTFMKMAKLDESFYDQYQLYLKQKSKKIKMEKNKSYLDYKELIGGISLILEDASKNCDECNEYIFFSPQYRDGLKFCSGHCVIDRSKRLQGNNPIRHNSFSSVNSTNKKSSIAKPNAKLNRKQQKVQKELVKQLDARKDFFDPKTIAQQKKNTSSESNKNNNLSFLFAKKK